MDLYQGSFDLVNQKHDFSPGIPPSGLFWTQPIPQDNVVVHFGDGHASVTVRNLAEQDAGNVKNALQGGPTNPGNVSFDMRFFAMGHPMAITDPVHRFTGKFFISDLTIAWSASTTGFAFQSDPANTSNSLRSVFGRERNGVFFDQDDDDD